MLPEPFLVSNQEVSLEDFHCQDLGCAGCAPLHVIMLLQSEVRHARMTAAHLAGCS